MQLISVRSRKQEQESRLCSYDLEETWTNDSSTSSMRSNNDNAEDEKEQGGGVHDVKISRIPLSLQKVFVDSWDGIEVKEAPVEASKTFNSPRNQRSWSFHVSLKGIVSKDKQESNIPAATKGTVRIGFRRSASKIVSPPIEEPIQPIVPKKPKFLATLAPQDYLDGLLRSRGYSTTRYRSTETGYYNKATPLQIASYGSHIVNILRKGDDANLRRYLRSGLAYNPSNLYGESLIHVACRLQRPGDNRLLINTMIEYGADVRIADDKGRTPLHDACWTYKPCFELIKTLLKHDSHLLMITDVRDCLPLSYAPRESWHDWLQFLQANKDTLWPSLTTKQTQNAGLSNPSSHRPSQVPPLTLQKPNSRPAEDPVHALSLKIAEMVSIGKLEPEEAMFLSTIDAIEDMDESYSDDDDDSDDDDSENSEEYAE